MGLIYGGIKNIKTGDEYDWEGETPETVLADLNKLQSTDYRVHWVYAGDIGDEGDIFYSSDRGDFVYRGEDAVKCLIDDIKLDLQ